MSVLARWLLGGIWGIWLTLPAIALARSASDLLMLYGTCLAVAGVGVGLLWVATFGLRQLWHPERVRVASDSRSLRSPRLRPDHDGLRGGLSDRLN